MRHQSLLTLFPSIWWAAVEAPHRKPSGKLVEVCVIVRSVFLVRVGGPSGVHAAGGTRAESLAGLGPAAGVPGSFEPGGRDALGEVPL
ncbi:hypothetical protein GCM10022207_83670 [Streptomyces lannensis]|uniref:Secreted protein n=1 Tax=Streptomyces lannensis TaxID=766498 RepID=A0ABP7LHI8_9ACTN